MSTVELIEEYIQTGNTSALRELLNGNPNLARCSTSHGISPLMLSCYYKKAEVANTLLSYVEELNIHETAALGKFDSTANIIYNNPASIDSVSADGFTPLGLASYFGHEEIVRYLLLKGADANIPSKNGYNVYPLHSSVAASYNVITKILLEAGALVNISQSSGITPLHSAAQSGNIEILILLLEAGADITARNQDGRTPADMAYVSGHLEIARILVN